MKRMAVIFNSDYQQWPMGGMITYVNETVSMLSDSFEIELWGCAVDGRPPDPVEIGGIRRPIHVNTTAKTQKKLIPNVVKCFWGNLTGSHIFRLDRYDILYFHLSASELGWLFGESLKHPFTRKTNRPLVILHQHGMAYGKAVGDRLDYFAMDQADLVFFTTDQNSLERHRRHINNPNVVWMPSMVDTTFFRPVSVEEKREFRKKQDIGQEKKVFIFTGRITPWKNPLLLLDAFEIYQKRNGGNGYLIFAGDGDSLPAVKNRIKERSLEESVRLTGRLNRQEIRFFLQSSDVFVMPSKGEGVSVATLEAMAVGLPVTAFDVEGMSGLIGAQSGVLVREQNSEAFADGMERAVKDQFRARDTAEQYCVDRVRDRMLRSIQMALKGKNHDDTI